MLKAIGSIKKLKESCKIIYYLILWTIAISMVLNLYSYTINNYMFYRREHLLL